MPLKLDDSYIFNKYPRYKQDIFKFIMQGERIDPKSSEFEDIRFDVKRRQISNALVKVLDDDRVVLMTSVNPLPNKFKVFIAKDIKGNHLKHKVYIDVSSIIYKEDGVYKTRRSGVDILIAYLISAMNQIIYYSGDGLKRLSSIDILTNGAECYAKLFTSIIDYIYKISVVGNSKARCMYLTAYYYVNTVMENERNAKAIAAKIADISEREVDVIELRLDKDSFRDIPSFVGTLDEVLKLNGITLDVISEKWMLLYGSGTVLGLELYTQFAEMITNAYVGCFINNQKTIEKLTGRSMVEFTKSLLRVGEGAI